MNPLSFFKYPAYIYNPRQVISRLAREFGRAEGSDVVQLPWGHRIGINPDDFIGKAIATQGIHEIDVCEAITRLVRSGDTVIDVGANIGFITSLMARVVGKDGRVLAFEPHPHLYSRLTANIARFDDGRSGKVSAECAALSDHEGHDWLVFDSDIFLRNSGTAGLRGAGFASGEEKIMVATRKLDSVIAGAEVSLLKVDVEGAELSVLHGAEQALKERRIGAILYEDFNSAKSGIASHLQRFGFSVFYLDGNLFGPSISEVNGAFRQKPRGRDENFLAVLDPNRAFKKYRQWGWHVFGL